MIPELDATGYNYNFDNYMAEFERLLVGISLCYSMMIASKVNVPNKENEIRDILLKGYLKNNDIRKEIKLNDYLFDREVPEDYSLGRTDIKVQTKNTFIRTEAYYIIECKRIENKNLVGTTGLNAEYIKNGICRFVSKHYSSFYSINALIGFVVEKMDIESNINNINFLLKEHFKNASTTRFIEREYFIPNFDYHFSSSHKDLESNNLTLHHLMFDLSNNIQDTI